MSETERLPASCVSASDPIGVLADRFEREDVPALIVRDDQGSVLGIAEAEALRRACVRGQAEAKVETLLQEVPTVSEAEMDGAFPSFADPCGPAGLPVVDAEGTPVGLLVPRLPDEPLEAVIMAGGEGRRLRPQTESIPKPLLPIGGKPIIHYIIAHLKKHGVTRFHLTLNYLREQFEQSLGDGRTLGVAIETVVEPQKLGTAGAIGLLKDRLKSPFLVINGDILTSLNVSALRRYHLRRGLGITVATHPYHVEVPYGIMRQDEAGHVQGVDEKPTLHFEANAGIYMMSPEVLQHIPAGRYCDMTEMIDACPQRGLPVGSFPMIEYWTDIGKPEDFERARRELHRLG
ncbi:MAG: nucleotidyltransferase family protein [Planctomycetota bacterium]